MMRDNGHSTSYRLAIAAVVCALVPGAQAASGATGGAAQACRTSRHCHMRVQKRRRLGLRLCVRYRCSIVAADAHVEVMFVVGGRGKRYKEVIYARWSPTGRLTRLGEFPTARRSSFSTTNSYGPVALAGRYVAFQRPRRARPRSARELVLERVNVKTGRRVVRRPASANEVGVIVSHVLTPTGTAAWIETSEPCKVVPGASPTHGSARIECEGANVVLARQTPHSAPETTVLASSPTIDPSSLALADGHLYWSEGGQPREAAI